MYYTLTLSEQDLATISQCLMGGPYGAVKPVVDSVNAQIEAEKAKQAPPPVAPKKRRNPAQEVAK